ncbi:MAG: ATP-binding protein [Anaerolineaceae bacterium]|nr:ATP-binding protein [Anaerolineaceae bacterium]
MAARTFNAELDNLAVIRTYVEETGLSLHAQAKAVGEIVQAVDEAATNVIVHGYQGQPGLIEIEVEQENECLAVRIRDQAFYFDPTSVPPPDLTLPLNKRPMGGLGVHLIRTLMDEFRYAALSQGGNELTLKKRAFISG